MTIEKKLGDVPVNGTNDWKFEMQSILDRVYYGRNNPAISRNEATNATHPTNPSDLGAGHCLYSLPMSTSFKAGPSYGSLRQRSDI